VLLSCGAVLLPLISLHHEPRTRGVASRVDASASSLELASRLAPQRASRSASRLAVATAATTTTIIELTTTTASAPVVTAAVRSTPTTARRSSTTRTTAKHHTTTTAKKKSTTTTSKPPPKEPPKPRPFTPPGPASSTGQSELGQATWYQSPTPEGCAHKTIPMGTIVTVVNVENGKSVTCKVADRGPYAEGKIIDLSSEAFSVLAPPSEGVIDVRVEW
jgi:rare lipoprotein A